MRRHGLGVAMKFVSNLFTTVVLLTAVSINSEAGVDGRVPRGLGDDVIIKNYTVRFVEHVDGRKKPFCSGVVTSPGRVTTAGHCLSGMSKENIFVEIYNPKTKKYTEHAIKNMAYVDSRDLRSDVEDLGIVALVDPPADYPNGSLGITKSCDTNAPLISAGFGMNETGQVGQLRLNEYVVQRTNSRKLKQEVFLKQKEGSTCYGDSGGPVFCRIGGRLAIVGINASITEGSDPISLRPDEQKKNPGFCRGNRYLRAVGVVAANERVNEISDALTHVDKEENQVAQ